ncbi:MAG: oligosaccharide flippase family protein [Bacteroidota bacterium]
MSDDRTFGLQTAKNAIWNSAFFVFSVFFGFITAPILVRKIGVDGFGLYGLIISVLAPLNLTNLGFGEATVKFVAQFYKEKNFGKVQEYISTTFFMSLCVGVFGAVALAFFGSSLAEAVFKIPVQQKIIVQQIFYVVAAGWFIQSIMSIFIAILPAVQNYKSLTIGNTILLVINSSLAICVVLFGGGLLGYTIATVTGTLISLIWWYVVTKRMLPQITFVPKLYKSAWQSSFRFGGWHTIGQVGGIMANQSDKYLLGTFLSTTAVGIYNVALSIEQTAYLSIWRLAEVLFPAFSSISNEPREHHFRLLMRATWLLTALAVSALISVIPISYDLLKLWINEDVARQGSIVLQMLCLGGTLGCAQNATYFYILGTGRTKLLALFSIISGVITFSVAFSVLPVYGLKAAGVSGVAAQIVFNLIVYPILYRKIFGKNLSFKTLFSAMYFPVLIGLGIAVGLSMSGLIHADNWFVLVFWYFLIAGITLSLIILLNRITPGYRERENDMRLITERVIINIKQYIRKK